MLRKLLLCFILSLCMVLSCCLPAAATTELSFPDHAMTLHIPDQFAVIHENNVLSQGALLSQFGVTATETDVKFKEDGYLFLAISSTMRCTMFLSQQTDAVSVTIGDLISYNNPQTARTALLGTNLPEDAVVKEIEQNGALFYRVDFGVTNGVGRIAYFTVINGTAYTLCLIDNNGVPSQNANSALDFTFENWQYTVAAEAERIDAFKDQATEVLWWIATPLLILAAGWLIRLVVRDLRRRRLEESRRNVTPKKPRR